MAPAPDDHRNATTYILEVSTGTGRPGYAHFTSRAHGEIAFEKAVAKQSGDHIRLIQADSGRQTTLMEHGGAKAPPAAAARPAPKKPAKRASDPRRMATVVTFVLILLILFYVAKTMYGK